MKKLLISVVALTTSLFAQANNISVLEQRAKQGDAEAQANLCVAYVNGLGVRKDINKAKEWCGKSAENDNVSSQSYLGHIFYNERNYPKALEYLESAANKGNTDATTLLGDMYNFGAGVTKDLEKAKYWYQKGADVGYGPTEYALGELYFVMANNTGGNEEQYRQAKYWLEKAADKKIVHSYYFLGILYSEGLGGILKNFNIAKNYFDQGIAGGDASAMVGLGYLYHEGSDNFPKNYQQAKYWYERAVNVGNKDYAMNNLAELYEDGLGVKQDIAKAKELYGVACENGLQEACDKYKALNK